MDDLANLMKQAERYGMYRKEEKGEDKEGEDEEGKSRYEKMMEAKYKKLLRGKALQKYLG